MYKRYLTVIIVLITLVGCFFLFFDKPTNKELYNKYLKKINHQEDFVDVSNSKDLKLEVVYEYINNQYHYVITITSNKTLNNFKALVVPSETNENKYYPSFGIFDNENINLVHSEPGDNETKGVNLVVSNREKIETFKMYVSYDNYEYYYLVNVGE